MVSTTVGTTVTNSNAVSFTSFLLSHLTDSKKLFIEHAIRCDVNHGIGMYFAFFDNVFFDNVV